MKVSVKVNPASKIEQIQPSLDGSLKVWLKAKPKNGEANRELVKLLANYYKVSKSHIQIISGLTSRNKVVEIES